MSIKNQPAYINSLKSLKAEKAALHLRLTEREKDLQERAGKLPLEVIKSTAGKVIPFFLNKRVAAMSWMIVKGISGLVFRKKSTPNQNIKKSMFSSIKQWGFVALAKTVYGLFSK